MKYEKKIDSEVQSRVDDIIRQKDEMLRTMQKTQATFEEKEAAIEKMKLLVAKKKSDCEKEVEEHSNTKDELSKANYKNKQLEKKLQQAKQ